MNIVAFAQALRLLCRRVPLRPFHITLADGTVLFVHHPEAIALRKGHWVFVTPARQRHYLDNTSVCQLIYPAPDAPA